jgi:hypothetical protein
MTQQRTALSRPYELKPGEHAAIEAFVARYDSQPPAPRIKLSTQNGALKRELDHPEPAVGQALLMQALGTTSVDFADGLVGQLVGASQGDESDANFLFAVAKSIAPKDEIEAMLACQMAAVHAATMNFARDLGCARTLEQLDSAERAVSKLARTFALQVEALKRYRIGGEQRVTAQHVTINDGGQAIVGNVSARAGGGDQKKTEATP